MGMRVGSGGNSAVMAQMQAAQRAAAPPPAPAPQPVASANDTQIQSILSMLSGTGSKVDVKA